MGSLLTNSGEILQWQTLHVANLKADKRKLTNVFLFLSTNLSLQAASPRWEPQIAVLCEAGQSYHPQHLAEEGRWTTALNIKTAGTTCLRDKMDLLDHCKKVNTDILLGTIDRFVDHSHNRPCAMALLPRRLKSISHWDRLLVKVDFKVSGISPHGSEWGMKGVRFRLLPSFHPGSRHLARRASMKYQ